MIPLALAKLLGEIGDALFGPLLARLIPILAKELAHEIAQEFRDIGTVSTPNSALQSLWDDGVRTASDLHSAGRSDSIGPANTASKSLGSDGSKPGTSVNGG